MKIQERRLRSWIWMGMTTVFRLVSFLYFFSDKISTTYATVKHTFYTVSIITVDIFSSLTYVSYALES